MKRLFTLLTLLLLIAGPISAQIYTSMADGALNDTAIWSTDGGVTFCSCAPTTELPSYSLMNMGSVEINHTITAPKHVIVLGYNLILNINPGGRFTGDVDLELRSGVINNYATMDFDQVTVFNSGYLVSTGVLTVDPGNLDVAWQGRMDIGGQVFVPNGNITNLGWINILRDAQVLAGAQIINDGIVNIEPGACVNVTGDFLNNVEVNLVNGPGTAYVESGNNVTNLGFWDTQVDWCAAGTGSGLSHASNCSSCGTLPVELVAFEAVVEDGTVVLNWHTASETNNRYFTLERSADGTDFSPVMEIASESPENGKLYSALDPAPYYGVSWYRLSQTDMDGTVHQLETVAVLNEDAAVSHFMAFPNPFGESVKVTTYGLEGAPAVLRMADLFGHEVATMQVDAATDFAVYTLPVGELEPGLYILTVSGRQITESFKLLHR